MDNWPAPSSGVILNDVVEIIVQNETVVIDLEDYEFVQRLGLSITRRENLKHVSINTKPYHRQYLHRVLLGVTDPSIIVDHEDGNGLNNRRKNLRKTNKVGNALNMRVNKNKKSGLPKGVYRERDGYKAQVNINYISWYLGHFDTVEEAETVYLRKVQSYWATQKEQ